MTVSATDFPFSAICDGSTSAFYFTSPIIKAEDLVITKRTAAGVDTILTMGTEYEVTGENNKFSSGGYITTVTYISGSRALKNWDSGDTIIIDRSTDTTQDTDYKPGRKLDLALIGESFDKLTIILQEQANLIGRMLSVPVGDVASSLEIPSVTSRASKFLCFDSDGIPTVAAGVTASDVVVSAFMESVVGAANAAAVRVLLDLTYGSVAEGKAGTSSALMINPAVLAAVIQNGTMTYAVASGTDTYTANLVPPISEYIEGAVYYIRFTNANLTASPTLALNGLAAKTIKRNNTGGIVNPQIGDIPSGSRNALLYSNGYFHLLNSYKLFSGQVPNGLIVEAMLGAGSVTENKLGDASIIAGKLANNAVAAANLIDGCVTKAKLGSHFVAGTVITLASAPTTRTTSVTSYTKLKEIRLEMGGTVTVTFTLQCSCYDTANSAKARIYKNGVAFGTERANVNNDPIIFSENLAFVGGDLIQIYAKKVSYNAVISDVLVQCATIEATVITN